MNPPFSAEYLKFWLLNMGGVKQNYSIEDPQVGGVFQNWGIQIWWKSSEEKSSFYNLVHKICFRHGLVLVVLSSRVAVYEKWVDVQVRGGGITQTGRDSKRWGQYTWL